MTTKIVSHEGDELSPEETIVSLMQRLRRAELLIEANSEMIDIIFQRLTYLEQDSHDWRIV